MRSLFIMLLVGLCACAETSGPEGCEQLSVLISEQSVEVEKLDAAFRRGGFESNEFVAHIESIEGRQLHVVDRCMSYAMNAGAKCSEYHDVRTLRDVGTIMRALRIAVDGEKPPSRVFVSGMLDAASEALARPKKGSSCFNRKR